MQPGYVPFSGLIANDPVSAEFYCNGDVQNYDNIEWVGGEDTYCAGFNARVHTLTVCKVIQDADGNYIADPGIDTDFSVDINGPDDNDAHVDFSTPLSIQYQIPNGPSVPADCTSTVSSRTREPTTTRRKVASRRCLGDSRFLGHGPTVPASARRRHERHGNCNGDLVIDNGNNYNRTLIILNKLKSRATVHVNKLVCADGQFPVDFARPIDGDTGDDLDCDPASGWSSSSIAAMAGRIRQRHECRRRCVAGCRGIAGPDNQGQGGLQDPYNLAQLSCHNDTGKSDDRRLDDERLAGR